MEHVAFLLQVPGSDLLDWKLLLHMGCLMVSVTCFLVGLSPDPSGHVPIYLKTGLELCQNAVSAVHVGAGMVFQYFRKCVPVLPFSGLRHWPKTNIKLAGRLLVASGEMY